MFILFIKGIFLFIEIIEKVDDGDITYYDPLHSNILLLRLFALVMLFSVVWLILIFTWFYFGLSSVSESSSNLLNS